MRAALSLVGVMPGQRGENGFEGGDSVMEGNGHPAPSTVLVVEDEVLVRMAVADHLRHRGYRVLEAKTGEEAQAILRAGELVEILFCDIDLGSGINGVELARWTRENFRDIRILLTSGVWRSAQVADVGDGPLVAKPYSYDFLTAQIGKLLGAMGRRGG
ncbi:MAG: response regulator [Reyranellaceae bacterium]